MLTTEEQVYVETYLATFSKGKAYQASHPQATWDSCRSNSKRWARKPHIKAEIERRLEEVLGEKHIIANKYLSLLDDMACGEVDEPIDYKTRIDAMKLILNELGKVKVEEVEQKIVIRLED